MCIQLIKKPLKLNEKTKKKTEDSINKKPPKFNKRIEIKTDYLLFCRR